MKLFFEENGFDESGFCRGPGFNVISPKMPSLRGVLLPLPVPRSLV